MKPPVEVFETYAPGWPGIPPRWTSSAKSGVGTSLDRTSLVWFTLSHGILNEIYYPRVDSACTRDMGFIVTDGASYFSEEKRDAKSEVSRLADGVPAFHLRNTANDGRYRIEKDVLADPATHVLLQRVRFAPLAGDPGAFRLYALLAPHLNNHGGGNDAWLGDYKGTAMLFAARDGYALALACDAPWLARSAGFVGASDGWGELRRDGRLRRSFERASNGNVALTGEIDLDACDGAFVVAIAFGGTATEAGQRAIASLTKGFPACAAAYIDAWQQWHHGRTTRVAIGEPAARRLVQFSAAMLRVHASKAFEGGVIASLSIPWGFQKGDDDLGGYHLVWPRDLVETAGGFLAVGADADARAVLRYLQTTQEADGHWSQNMWLDGTPYWNGVQMDETALPVLLVDLASRAGALTDAERAACWPMVRRAAGFIVRCGPVTQQDRWEEDPGYSPFTLGAEIAALLVAAEMADSVGEPAVATYLRETADAWYDAIDDWMYVAGTRLAEDCGVEGYYVRVCTPDEAEAASPKDGYVPIKNRPPSEDRTRAALMVSPDVLAFVRFGLRAANDPRIVNTIRVIDAVLKVDTPHGPAWRRYNGDGYGEHQDGSPFDGTGTGRAWPLLTGERGHYEVAAGRIDRARELAATMEGFAGEGQLLPEQIWDAPDIPERELVNGEATGSARPLAWAHAEYLKLRRSIQDGLVFDQPPHPVDRYLAGSPPPAPFAVWRFNNKIKNMSAGRVLRVETQARALVHWGVNGWTEVQDVESTDTGLGIHVADLPTARLPAGARIDLTFYWPDGARWEGADFHVVIDGRGRRC
ncbi:MAG: glucan 1,4-alpha-glucosidase [Betaproteobacteria bacterium]